jgi:TRAP-type uncharacterized transport system substrate-binding protein
VITATTNAERWYVKARNAEPYSSIRRSTPLLTVPAALVARDTQDLEFVYNVAERERAIAMLPT